MISVSQCKETLWVLFWAKYSMIDSKSRLFAILCSIANTDRDTTLLSNSLNYFSMVDIVFIWFLIYLTVHFSFIWHFYLIIKFIFLVNTIKYYLWMKFYVSCNTRAYVLRLKPLNPPFLVPSYPLPPIRAFAHFPPSFSHVSGEIWWIGISFGFYAYFLLFNLFMDFLCLFSPIFCCTHQISCFCKPSNFPLTIKSSPPDRA